MQALRNLLIENCPKLMRLTIAPQDPTSNNLTPQLVELKKLMIGECEGVESLEEITAGELLESLTIYDCENIRSLPRCLHALSYLTELRIVGCLALEIEEFPPLPITLSFFELYDCPKIKALPNQWYHLASLRMLYIRNCPNIECFPKGGFPPNLQSLIIGGCENVKQIVREWGLPLLTSLKRLTIDLGRRMGGGEGEKVWFPSKDEDAWSLLFPSSLTFLEIWNMTKVERLSSSLRNHLSSLQWLTICNCPKLRYLPEDGLPPSIQHLHIWGCSNLKEGCSKPTGHYWPLIREIPSIHIDGVRIQ